MRSGEASRFDLVRADSQARSTQSILPSLEADARTAAYRLVLLPGRPPETLQDELTEPRPLPRTPATISAGLRHDLPHPPPEIRTTEHELRPSPSAIAPATPDLFPQTPLL